MPGRFDDEGYLRRWQDAGEWPGIHDAIFNFFMRNALGDDSGYVLDLCCSTALLGKRIAVATGRSVVGIDRDARALGAAQQYGVTKGVGRVLLERGPVVGPEFSTLAGLLRMYEPSVVVARRCLPEILGDHPGWDEAFRVLLRRSSVEQVFLQGRVPVRSPSNRLSELAFEEAVLQPVFITTAREGQCAALRRAEP